jgi:peptide/nickel transport system permease protein
LPQGFARFIARRLAAAVLLCLGATLVSFLLVQVVPANPVVANLSDQSSNNPAAIAAFRHQWGLDQPLPVQYYDYLRNVVHGNLGVSEQTHRPVLKDLEEFVPATIELAIPAMLLAGLLGVALGTVAAVRHGRMSDHAIRVTSLLGLSTPPFWLALIALYVFFFKLGWFPSGNRLNPILTAPPKTTGLYTIDAMLHGQWSVARDALSHLVLPVCVLAVYVVGLLSRFTRSSVLEVLHNDYVRTAHAKGVPAHVVLFRHTLRAALVPVITVGGLAFGSLLSGAVLVENIFSWPGVGQYAYNSAINLDLPAIMGVSLLVAIVYVAVNLIVDILYGIIDPRIRVA